MALFASYPSYSRYRALRLSDAMLRGEDVFALQSMIRVDTDGVFGKQTDAAVRSFQKGLGLTVDGVVGPATWAAGVARIAKGAGAEHGIAAGLLYGQLSHESGLRGGNYSPMRDNGSYDAGVAQRNTAHTPAREGFDVPLSIDVLARNTRNYYDLFSGLPVRRRWTLAAGAWNAPAYACWFAKQEGASKVKASQTAKPGVKATGLFTAYLRDVTHYLKT